LPDTTAQSSIAVAAGRVERSTERRPATIKYLVRARLNFQ